MSGTVIFIVVIIATYYLGKFAITEGQRVEQNKKFMKNLENFDKPKNKK